MLHQGCRTDRVAASALALGFHRHRRLGHVAGCYIVNLQGWTTFWGPDSKVVSSPDSCSTTHPEVVTAMQEVPVWPTMTAYISDSFIRGPLSTPLERLHPSPRRLTEAPESEGDRGIPCSFAASVTKTRLPIVMILYLRGPLNFNSVSEQHDCAPRVDDVVIGRIDDDFLSGCLSAHRRACRKEAGRPQSRISSRWRS